MAIRWIEGALTRSESQGTARMVLVVLANNADDESGTCYPGIAYIANRAGVSLRTVHAALKSLESIGEITIKRNHGVHGTNVYTLSKALVQSAESAPPCNSRKSVPKAQNLHPQSAESAPEPSVEPSEDKEIKIDTPIPPSPKRNINGFESWYKLYPRKEGRHKAEDAWRGMTAAERDAATDGLPRFLPAYESCERWFIPLPATWLNQKRWLDEETPPIKTHGKPIAQRDNLPTSDEWATGAGWLNENGVASL